jgi:hypothetical protein
MPRRFLPLLCLLSLFALLSGCASRTTAGGGRETSMLGGVMVVTAKSYVPPEPTTFAVDTTKLHPIGDPSGTKTTLFWGLITLADY